VSRTITITAKTVVQWLGWFLFAALLFASVVTTYNAELVAGGYRGIAVAQIVIDAQKRTIAQDERTIKILSDALASKTEECNWYKTQYEGMVKDIADKIVPFFKQLGYSPLYVGGSIYYPKGEIAGPNPGENRSVKDMEK
jgi:hypothetical protein